MAVNSDLKERLMRLWGSNTLRLQKVRSASMSGLSQSGPVWSVFEDPATKTGAETKNRRSQTMTDYVISRNSSTENTDVGYSASNETSAKSEKVSKRRGNMVSSYVDQFNRCKSISESNDVCKSEDLLMNNDHQNVSRVSSKSVSGYASQLNSLESCPDKEEIGSKSEKTDVNKDNQEKLITGRSVSKYVQMLNSLNSSFESSNGSLPVSVTIAADDSSLTSLPRARTYPCYKARAESIEKTTSPRDRLTSYGSESYSNSEAGSEVFDDQDRSSASRSKRVSSYVKLLNSGKPIDLPNDTNGSLSITEENNRVDDGASFKRTSLENYFGNGEDCYDGKRGQKRGTEGKGGSHFFNDPRGSQNYSEMATIAVKSNAKLEESKGVNVHDLTNQFTEDEVDDSQRQNSEIDQLSSFGFANGQINAGSTKAPDYEHERLPEEKQRISKTDFQRVREKMNRLEQEEVVTVERKGSTERKKVVSGNILEISKRFSGNLN